MELIPITQIPGIKIGQVEDAQAATGLTVILAPSAMAASIDVRGGGPASRDTRILDPLAQAEAIHAVVLAGGSAFGLDAAGGVMRFLEEQGIGLEVGPVHVPLVCQSDIFDLGVGDPFTRPDADMGYAACQAAWIDGGTYTDGNFGAGCGATVGKILGPEFCMKSGIGSHAIKAGDLIVGALVVVNAIGDVRDSATGKRVAGVLNPEKNGLLSTDQILVGGYEAQAAPTQITSGASSTTEPEAPSIAQVGPTTNTTIGAIITNANLNKAQLAKVAGMAHDGFARAITPVHTGMDGDSIYALSLSEQGPRGIVDAPVDLVGSLAANVMEQAILTAVRAASPAYGLKAACDLE